MKENFQSVIEHIKESLSLTFPYSDHTQREFISSRSTRPIPAAVLVLVGFSGENIRLDQSSLLFVRRTDSVETHRGQMAFPGGHAETGEMGHPAQTALRETTEEVGVPASAVEIVGRLPSLLTATGYQIEPIVGILKTPISLVPLKLDSREIAEALWVPLTRLMEPGVYRQEIFSVEGRQYPIHVYHVGSHRIWGATGSMTKNFLDRMESQR